MENAAGFRPNIFGHGVPFKFPSPPDTGPGLTRLGKQLVRACNRLGIMVDDVIAGIFALVCVQWVYLVFPTIA